MERRIHARVEVSHPVLYLTDIYPRPKVASTIDLSLGGAKIESLSSLAKEERLRVSIAIQPEVIECRGKVAYVLERDNGRIEAGIQFEDLTEPDRLYLRQYLLHVMEQRALEATLSVE